MLRHIRLFLHFRPRDTLYFRLSELVVIQLWIQNKGGEGGEGGERIFLIDA